MWNQARLQICTKWLIISTLQPAISYYSNKLHLMITEEMKVGFMTLELKAKDGESLKFILRRKNGFACVHLIRTQEIKV